MPGDSVFLMVLGCCQYLIVESYKSCMTLWSIRQLSAWAASVFQFAPVEQSNAAASLTFSSCLHSFSFFLTLPLLSLVFNIFAFLLFFLLILVSDLRCSIVIISKGHFYLNQDKNSTSGLDTEKCGLMRLKLNQYESKLYIKYWR